MQVNSISNTNPNFQAKFVMDSKGILREAYQYGKITDAGKELLGKFSNLGKGQEVEFVGKYMGGKSIFPPLFPFFCDDIFKIFNRTTGKTVSATVEMGEPLWDKVLKTLVEDKDFFKPDRFWQELTGQKVVSWIKK